MGKRETRATGDGRSAGRSGFGFSGKTRRQVLALALSCALLAPWLAWCISPPRGPRAASEHLLPRVPGCPGHAYESQSQPLPGEALNFSITFEALALVDGVLEVADPHPGSIDHMGIIRFAFHFQNSHPNNYTITRIGSLEVAVPEQEEYLIMLSDVIIPFGGWHVGAGEEKTFYPLWCNTKTGDCHDVAFRIAGKQAKLPDTERATLGGNETVIRPVKIWDWFIGDPRERNSFFHGFQVLANLFSGHGLGDLEVMVPLRPSTLATFHASVGIDVFNGSTKLLAYSHPANVSSTIVVPAATLGLAGSSVVADLAVTVQVLATLAAIVAVVKVSRAKRLRVEPGHAKRLLATERVSIAAMLAGLLASFIGVAVVDHALASAMFSTVNFSTIHYIFVASVSLFVYLRLVWIHKD